MLGDLLPLLTESSLSTSAPLCAPGPRDSLPASLRLDLSSGASELHAECEEGLLGVSPKVQSASAAVRPLTWAGPLPALSGAAKAKSARGGGCSTTSRRIGSFFCLCGCPSGESGYALLASSCFSGEVWLGTQADFKPLGDALLWLYKSGPKYPPCEGEGVRLLGAGVEGLQAALEKS